MTVRYTRTYGINDMCSSVLVSAMEHVNRQDPQTTFAILRSADASESRRIVVRTIGKQSRDYAARTLVNSGASLVNTQEV